MKTAYMEVHISILKKKPFSSVVATFQRCFDTFCKCPSIGFLLHRGFYRLSESVSNWILKLLNNNTSQ